MEEPATTAPAPDTHDAETADALAAISRRVSVIESAKQLGAATTIRAQVLAAVIAAVVVGLLFSAVHFLIARFKARTPRS